MSEKNVTYSVLGQPAQSSEVRVNIGDASLGSMADALSVIAEHCIKVAERPIHVSLTPKIEPVPQPLEVHVEPTPLTINVPELRPEIKINIQPAPVTLSATSLNANLRLAPSHSQKLAVLALYLIVVILSLIAFVLVKHYSL